MEAATIPAAPWVWGTSSIKVTPEEQPCISARCQDEGNYHPLLNNTKGFFPPPPLSKLLKTMTPGKHNKSGGIYSCMLQVKALSVSQPWDSSQKAPLSGCSVLGSIGALKEAGAWDKLSRKDWGVLGIFLRFSVQTVPQGRARLSRWARHPLPGGDPGVTELGMW